MELLFAVLVLGMALNGCLAQYPYQQLRLHLFKDYDKYARPVVQASKGISIEASMSPIYLSSLDEETSKMTLQGWITFKWQDEFLKWDPSSFSGIKSISLPSNEVWKPDFSVYNNLPTKNVDLVGKTNVLAYSDGSVLWVPAITFETFCPMDRKRDVQKCNITIGSWTENVQAIDFTLAEKSIDMSYYSLNALWKLVGTEAIRQQKFYECCKEPYVSIVFAFDFVKSGSGHVNIKEVMCGTTFVAIVLALAMFWLPSDSDKKFTLGSLSVLILAMLLHLGHASKTVMAASVSFTKVALFIVVLAILVEIVVVNISRMRSPCKAPSFLMSGTVGRVLLLIPSSAPRSSQHQDAEKNGKTVLHLNSPEGKESQPEWGLIATALDRVFFIAFLVAFIVERSV